MKAISSSLFKGTTKRRWVAYVIIWLAIALIFGFVYDTARKAVLDEIRAAAMGVAIATAGGITPEDIQEITNPDDTSKDAFKRIQSHLDRISKNNPDVRYMYTMRRDFSEGARLHDFQYVVDQPASDDNQNGVIDPDEITELPGNEYDAADYPEMIGAWNTPTADQEITPDPPYPDLISGYAPIKNSNGRTVAIVGVDITAATVRQKYAGIRAVNLIVGFILAVLVTMVIQLYFKQREAYEKIILLTDKLTSQNNRLQAANKKLSAHNQKPNQ